MDLQAEYDRAEPARLLDDAEYDCLASLPPEQLATLPSNTLHRYLATAKWHAGRRLGLDSIEGLEIGGLTVDEILARQAP